MADDETTGTEGEEENNESADDCNKTHQGPTDEGRRKIALAWQIAAAALATANAVTAANLAEKQMDLAYQYYHIAKNWKDWYNTGFVPLEDKELDEVWAEEMPEPHYDMAIGRAACFAKMGFVTSVKQAMKCNTQYHTGLREYMVKEAVRQLGDVIGLAESMGYRNERARLEIMKDRRWKRREVVVMRGRNMAAANVNYSSLAINIYGDLSKQAGGAAGGYMKFLGYSRYRLETMMNDMLKYVPKKEEARQQTSYSSPATRNIMDRWGRDYASGLTPKTEWDYYYDIMDNYPNKP